MKKSIIIVVLLFSTIGLKAQTNIQEMYDFNRGHLTTTLEMFQADRWGSSFWFVDIYHPDIALPSDFYSEISRSLNFWKDSKLGALSMHIEWNGGINASNCWLFGAEYMLHNKDFSNIFKFVLMYKYISGQDKNFPMQFTFFWEMKDLFSVKGLAFSGFLDVWGEKITWGLTDALTPDETDWVMLSEPQIWYNLGQHFNCENLHVGGEVELAYNFAGGYRTNWARNKGFNAAPCLGIKWIF